ncbi:MAG: hypothetical protein Tsb0014_05050 [Pleurocapsa sp.]
MIFQGKYLHLTLPVFITVTCAIFPTTATAQLIPDRTLGAESSVVTPQALQQFLIDGGAIRDSNLFHSFLEFNINNGQQVNFANPEGITNILTRVTGNNASNIFGTLGVNGDANLFLINPNGIVFGEGANININGSFFASTADSINFADGKSFSAVNPEAPPLLMVNMPIGLQLGNNPAAVEARQANIQAQDISLIGGDINLKQTTINAPRGEVNLGSLADGGIIDFNADFPIDIIRGNINLRDRSRINVLGTGEGSIIIDANNLTLDGESKLEAGIEEGLGELDTVAGKIELNATGDIYLDGNSTIFQRLKPNTQGDGGDIVIATNNLILRDRSKIQAETESSGNGGNIIIDAQQQVNLASPFPDDSVENPRDLAFKTLILSQTKETARGNGGNIYLNTPEVKVNLNAEIGTGVLKKGNGGNLYLTTDNLSISNGANISATTNALGDGGNIKIQADQIEVTTENDRPTRIDSVTREGATGDGGKIEIDTANLSLKGGIITADTMSDGNGGAIFIQASDRIELINSNPNFPGGIFTASRQQATGNGGNISIVTPYLLLKPGIKIDAGTATVGDGGNIDIQATELIELQGNNRDLFSTIYTQTNKMSSGNGGDVSIETPTLRLLSGSQISAATLGSGEGGTVSITSDLIEISGNIPFQPEVIGSLIPVADTVEGKIRSGIYASSPGLGNADALNIKTDNLSLDNGAQISVSSQQQGAAGNLNIDADTIRLNNSILSAETIEGERANIFLTAPDIQLRNNSLITTNARQTATGGNINIDTETLVALNNSDITANAEDNFGGRVLIEATGIFGTQVRDFNTTRSDITATSRLGAEFSGVVKIELADSDPTSGIIELPENFTDASQQIVSSCNLDKENSFVVTGRGGLPTNPLEFFAGETVLQDWRLLTDNKQLTINNEQSEIVEAQKWIINRRGLVELIADSTSVNRDLWLKAMNCNS